MGKKEESLAAKERVWGKGLWDPSISEEIAPHAQLWGEVVQTLPEKVLHLDHKRHEDPFLEAQV